MRMKASWTRNIIKRVTENSKSLICLMTKGKNWRTTPTKNNLQSKAFSLGNHHYLKTMIGLKRSR